MSITRTLHGLIIGGLLFAFGGPVTINYDAPTPNLVAEQLATITAGMNCTPESEPRLVDNIVVAYVGSTYVRMVDFDTAHDLAASGKVRVLAFCD